MEFINVVPYLTNLFKENPIHIVGNGSIVEPISFYGEFKKQVSINDGVLECNLRMIESYLPEILFYIGSENINGKNIYEIIKLCSAKKFPFSSIANSKRFLQFKMFYLFEAILFGEIFKKTWKGKWQNRNFVIKKDGHLEYYQMYSSRELISVLLDIIGVEVVRRDNEIQIQFVLLQWSNI